MHNINYENIVFIYGEIGNQLLLLYQIVLFPLAWHIDEHMTTFTQSHYNRQRLAMAFFESFTFSFSEELDFQHKLCVLLKWDSHSPKQFYLL